MTLYSTAAYTAGFQKRMTDMYDEMYGKNEGEDGAFGIAGLQLYHQGSMKEVQGIIDRVSSAKYIEINPETLQQSYHDKFMFTEDTTSAELFGHKVPKFVFTEGYANSVAEKVLKINKDAFGTANKSQNFRSAIPKSDLKGSTLVHLIDIEAQKPMTVTYDEAQGFINKNRKKYRLDRESIDEYFDVYEGEEGFKNLLQRDPDYAFTILKHLNTNYKDDFDKLWKKEVPAHHGKMKELGDATAIFNTIGSIIHAAGSKKGNKEAQQRAALSAMSILFPTARRFAGAFLGAQNLSQIFGGSK